MCIGVVVSNKGQHRPIVTVSSEVILSSATSLELIIQPGYIFQSVVMINFTSYSSMCCSVGVDNTEFGTATETQGTRVLFITYRLCAQPQLVSNDFITTSSTQMCTLQ